MIMGAMMTDIMKSSLIHSLSSIPYGRSNNCIAIIHTRSTRLNKQLRSVVSLKLWSFEHVQMCCYVCIMCLNFPCFLWFLTKLKRGGLYVKVMDGQTNVHLYDWAPLKEMLVLLIISCKCFCILRQLTSLKIRGMHSQTSDVHQLSLSLYLALCLHIFTSFVCLSLPSSVFQYLDVLPAPTMSLFVSVFVFHFLYLHVLLHHFKKKYSWCRWCARCRWSTGWCRR